MRGDVEMMTQAATCAFFGGDKPLHPSTLYRGIKAGRYPKPVHIGPNTARWVSSECHVARQKLIEAPRDGCAQPPAAPLGSKVSLERRTKPRPLSVGDEHAA
jgi:hypothetical protein